MVLEKDGEDYLDLSCEKGRNIKQRQKEKKYHTYNKMKQG
jgi:hypothetical protein